MHQKIQNICSLSVMGNCDNNALPTLWKLTKTVNSKYIINMTI